MVKSRTYKVKNGYNNTEKESTKRINKYGKSVYTNDYHDKLLSGLEETEHKVKNKMNNKIINDRAYNNVRTTNRVVSTDSLYIVSALAKHIDDTEDNLVWVYLGYDDKGTASTGYPIWSRQEDCAKFKTVREAEEAWLNDKCYLLGRKYEIVKGTLAVRKVTYKEIECL